MVAAGQTQSSPSSAAQTWRPQPVGDHSLPVLWLCSEEQRHPPGLAGEQAPVSMWLLPSEVTPAPLSSSAPEAPSGAANYTSSCRRPALVINAAPSTAGLASMWAELKLIKTLAGILVISMISSFSRAFAVFTIHVLKK